MSDTRKSIVITGVSSGIGLGCAAEFIKRGYQVFGSVRKQEDAGRVQGLLGASFIPLIFDVTDEVGILAAVQVVEAHLKGAGLSGLINNSGIAEGGPLQHVGMDTLRRQFEVNVFGLLRVTQAFLPLLGAREGHIGAPGKIMNVSSVAGKIAAPFLGLYAASKHAVEALSHSLRRELMLYGIDVVIIGPGAVATEIWDKAEGMEIPFKGTAYYNSLLKLRDYAKKEGESGLTIEEIGKQMADIFENPRAKTRYALLKGKFMKWTIPRLLPDRFVDWFIGKNFGLLKK